MTQDCINLDLRTKLKCTPPYQAIDLVLGLARLGAGHVPLGCRGVVGQKLLMLGGPTNWLVSVTQSNCCSWHAVALCTVQITHAVGSHTPLWLSLSPPALIYLTPPLVLPQVLLPCLSSPLFFPAPLLS